MVSKIENSDYTFQFRESQQEIEIRYRDSDYNQHFIVINNQDAFIINYLNRDINKLWKFIIDNDEKQQIIFNMDEFGKYYMIINEPVFLKYHLKCIGKNDVRVNQLVKENKKLINEVSSLKNLFEEFKKNTLFDHFDRNIFINSYDLNSEKLNLRIRDSINGKDLNFNNSFESLSLFHNIQDLTIGGTSNNLIFKYRNSSVLFQPISKLNLKILKIATISMLEDIDFTSTIHTLEEVELYNLSNLTCVSGLYQLSNLKKVIISECRSLGNVSGNFKSNIHLSQK